MTAKDKTYYNEFMQRCISLAKIAKDRGDSPVGSVLVKDGKIISEGIEGGKTHNDITYHAEIEAIRNAVKSLKKKNLSDCILVTTHEPCIMCSYVIRHHKIKLVVVGIKVDEIGGYSSFYPVLLDKKIKRWTKPPKIIDGVLEKECKELNN